ncbi:MAG: hypothetical protein RL675_128 [Bacteroidota bacterium]
MVWAIPFFFAAEENIEDVFEITYFQMDSARTQLIKQQTAYKQVQYTNWKDKATNFSVHSNAGCYARYQQG